MRPPPPPPPPKPAAPNKLMTIPEDWDKSGVASSIRPSTSSAGGGAVTSASSSSASISCDTANPAPNKQDSDDSDDSGSESDESTSNDTSDSEECSGSSSSTCSSTDSECSCSGSSCDQSRPSPSVRYSSSKKGGNGGGGGGTKEKAAPAAAAVAPSPSYAIAATKSRVFPTATTTVTSKSSTALPRPVPVESIKTEHRGTVMSGGVGDGSGAPSNVNQENLARSSVSSVLEMAHVVAVPGPKRKSLVAAVGKTNAMGDHQMVPKEVPILPPPPIALLQTIPATSIVFKSEPIYISQAEGCVGSDGINSLVPGAIIQSTRCSGGGRIAPKMPIPKDSAAFFSKPMLPLMPPPVASKAVSVAAVGASVGGGLKRTEFRLRPESDILKQSVVRAAAAAAAVSIPGRSGLAPVIGPRARTSGSKKKKSSATEKVSSNLKKKLLISLSRRVRSVLTNQPETPSVTYKK